MITEIDTKKWKHKPLGMYLLEASLITPKQLDLALQEQKGSSKQLGHILAASGWIEQQTIEYLMEKVVVPERLASEGHMSQPKPGDSDVLEPLNVPPHQLQVHLSPRRTLKFLLFVIFSLVLLGIFTQLSKLLPKYPLQNYLADLFNLDGELTVPALYSASALLFSGVLLASVADAKKVGGESYFRHWKALSIIFLYLSVDELLRLHERTNEWVDSTLKTDRSFILQGWVIPGIICVSICLLAFLRFLTHLPTKTRGLFLIAGTLYVMGSVGLEIVADRVYYSGSHVPFTIWVILIATEEFLEMLGIAIFSYALLSYISKNMKGLVLKINLIDDRKKRRSFTH